MCATFGYSGFEKNENLGYERFSIVNRLEPVENNYFTYPDQTAPIIIAHSPNKIYLAKWGFPVPWSPRPLINAQAETVDTLKSFAESFRLRRCLIPAQVFYEWDHRGSKPQMTLFRLKSNALFAMAGVYKEIPDPKTGKPIFHFVIITTEANELVRPIHTKNRMAAMLKRDNEHTWVNPDLTEASQLKPVLAPYPADEMECFVVDKNGRKKRNMYPDILPAAG
jgi:putative SOS response-associated peptidase YedK